MVRVIPRVRTAADRSQKQGNIDNGIKNILSFRLRMKKKMISHYYIISTSSKFPSPRAPSSPVYSTYILDYIYGEKSSSRRLGLSFNTLISCTTSENSICHNFFPLNRLLIDTFSGHRIHQLN